MPCPRCGTVNPDGPAFCGRCGVALRSTLAGPTGAGWNREVSGVPPRRFALMVLASWVAVGLAVLFGTIGTVVGVLVAGVVGRRMSKR